MDTHPLFFEDINFRFPSILCSSKFLLFCFYSFWFGFRIFHVGHCLKHLLILSHLFVFKSEMLESCLGIFWAWVELDWWNTLHHGWADICGFIERIPKWLYLYAFFLRSEKDASISCPEYGTQDGKYLAARILESGYGKEAGGLLYNVYIFTWPPCFQSSFLPQFSLEFMIL